MACNQEPSSEVAMLRRENTILRNELDSLKKKIAEPDTTQVTASDETKETYPEVKIRPGKHDFTLQWIGWDQPGSVMIGEEESGWHSIKGGQRSKKNDDYITISGKLKMISPIEVLFVGDIVSMVKSNNGGRPCIKSGEKVFKSTQNRQYWRMQDMINCEGGRLTDYVDLYF